MKTDFEDFLRTIHAEIYTGTDDDMIDAFEKWLMNLEMDELLRLGKVYGLECFVAGEKVGLQTAIKNL